MSTLQERIAEIMETTGLNVGQISAITGVSSSAVSQWKHGPTRSLQAGPATMLEAATKYSARWIATGEGPKFRADHSSVVALHPEDELPEDVVQIPEYQVRFSGGNGNTVVDYELAEESEAATYRLSWLQRLHLNPEKLKRFKVKGNSMEPLLFHGDSVLVNEAESGFENLVDGRVYAIRYGNELRVKRLYRKLDGTLTLRSENPEFRDEDVPPELAQQHITIIGRVRDKSGGGGL